MLDAFAGRTAAAPIDTVVNTHANGDHCYGNELVAGAEIIASTACAEEMGEVAPAMLAGLNSAPGDVGELFRSFFGDFDVRRHHADAADAHVRRPARRVDVGGREVELIEVGPAHTKGDAIVLRARRQGRCSPATSCSSAARRSCGPARWPTGWRRAT